MAMIILGLVLLPLIIGALLFTIHFQKRKLFAVYETLAARILDSIRIEDKLAEKKQMDGHPPSTLMEKFEIIMREQKLYLNPDLNLAGLAKQMGTDAATLSRLLKNHCGVHLKDYLNRLRVKEACRMMGNPEHDQYTMDQIFTRAGFSSKASFYSAFRKFTGMSPAAFRSQVNSRR
jgi:YesN/AraC family two-component response regulator